MKERSTKLMNKPYSKYTEGDWMSHLSKKSGNINTTEAEQLITSDAFPDFTTLLATVALIKDRTTINTVCFHFARYCLNTGDFINFCESFKNISGSKRNYYMTYCINSFANDNSLYEYCRLVCDEIDNLSQNTYDKLSKYIIMDVLREKTYEHSTFIQLCKEFIDPINKKMSFKVDYPLGQTLTSKSKVNKKTRDVIKKYNQIALDLGVLIRTHKKHMGNSIDIKQEINAGLYDIHKGVLRETAIVSYNNPFNVNSGVYKSDIISHILFNDMIRHLYQGLDI